MSASSLILIIGLPGTGKTTFAEVLASKLNAHHLNSDVVRHEIGKQGQYDTASKAAVYQELLDRTESLLKNNQTVIVDTTLFKKSLRLPYLVLARKYGLQAKWIELKASEAVIMKRVYKDRPFSEADYAVYLKIKAEFEPLELERLTLWTDQLSIEEMTTKAEKYISLTNAQAI